MLIRVRTPIDSQLVLICLAACKRNGRSGTVISIINFSAPLVRMPSSTDISQPRSKSRLSAWAVEKLSDS